MARELQSILDNGEITGLTFDASYTPGANAQPTTKKYVDEKDTAPLPFTFGNAPNQAALDDSGRLRFLGDAAVWRDYNAQALAQRLDNPGVGTLSYNYLNTSIAVAPNGVDGAANDTLAFSEEIPHEFLANTTAYLHIHWEQPTSQNYVFSLRYRIQRNGQTKTTAWTTLPDITMASNIYTYTSGTIIQMTGLAAIDLTGLAISDLLQFQLARVDATAGDIELLTIGLHIKVDGLGSSTATSK